MKRILPQVFAGAIFCAAAFGQSVPEIAFDSTPDFFKLPEGMYFGEVAGVAVNSKKHVFVLSRGNTSGPAYGAAAAQLLEFDSGGKFVREIGKNLYAWSFAHAVRVDRYDNIWVADKGSDVVVRFNPQAPGTRLLGVRSRPRTKARTRWNIQSRRCPRSTGCSGRSPIWPGTQATTFTSATATSIREWPRMTRMAT